MVHDDQGPAAAAAGPFDPRALVTRREFIFVCAGGLLAAAVFLLWMVAGIGGRTVTQAVREIGPGFAALVAGMLCLLRSRHESDRVRLGWTLIGTSALASGVGQIVLATKIIVEPHPSLPATSDAPGVLAALLAACGLVCLLGNTERGAASVRVLMDMAIVAGSLFFLGWVTFGDRLWHPRIGAPWPHAEADVLYWAADAIIAAAVILMFASPRPRQPSVTLLISALGVLAVSDVVFGYASGQAHTRAPDALIVGWVVGYLVLGIAALKTVYATDTGNQHAAFAKPIAAAVPYVFALICAAAVLGRAISRGGIEGSQLTLLASIFLLVILRHHLLVRENTSLISDLEARVAERASEMRQNENRLETMIGNVSDLVSVVRPGDGKMLYTSASSNDVLGYSSEELNGVSIFALVHAHDVPLMEGFLGAKGQAGGRASRIEVRMRHRDGSWRHTETSGADLSEDPVLGGVVLTTRDVTERKQLETQLTHQAFHDSLTGLPNRALFGDRLEHALARTERAGGSLAVLFVDLDDFKNVNDSFGHVTGDELLARVAQLLVTSLRPADTVARLGGDEFAILMEDAGEPEALELAARIKNEFAEPLLTIHGSATPVAASVGIAVTADDVRTSAELMRNADIAMYSAKNEGKSRCRVFEPSMHSVVLERVALSAELRHAIDRGELELHYQPVIELVTGRTLGFEALSRWRHPERGMIPPLEFISLAEENGLITPIGEWVLGEACRQMMAWDKQGVTDPGFGISVNVSGRQVADPDFVSAIDSILKSSKLDPRRLTIELTESTLLADTEATIAWLSMLKTVGIRLALDDFGTGFSSLSYLRRLPVDCLKVDASFVRSIAEDGSGGELALAVVNLARTLKLRTVAEGVEHPHQAEFLSRSGCRFAQGFHFSKPLPAEYVPGFLHRSNTARPVEPAVPSSNGHAAEPVEAVSA